MPSNLPREMRHLYGTCGCKCGESASIKEMILLQWETIASPERDAASPNFGIYDTTPPDMNSCLSKCPYNQHKPKFSLLKD